MAVRPHTLVLLYLATRIGVGSAEPRWVAGKYKNPALGYSVVLPHDLKGLAGDQAGPERGIRASLPSGGTVSVYGEANSFEWKSPAEGVRHELSYERCTPQQQEISPARVGSLKGAKGRLVCGGRVVVILLAFRPGGGSVYWLRLDTTSGSERSDATTLSDIAETFKLIRWQ